LYYLDEQEVRFLTHELLPRVRTSPVDERLRGWNWHESPVKPYSYKMPLSVWEIANRVCPTNRDVWIRRKLLRKSIPTTPYIAKGIIVHKVVSGLFKEAKKRVYLGDLDGLADILVEKGRSIAEDEASSMSKYVDLKDQMEEIMRFAKEISRYEATNIMARIMRVKSKYPFIDEESLVNLVFPFTVEMVIDGSFLGLSKYLRADAAWVYGGLVYDIKTGMKLQWHKLQVAGYALAIESFYERPVDIGVVVYVNMAPTGLRIEKDFFPITDDLRARFLELRDELQMMLLNDKEPPVASNCPRTCLFRKYCHGG
jgi:CRISPR-associated protein Csa1